MAEMDAHMAAFVQDVLTTFGERWVNGAKERIAGRKITVDEMLLNSVAANVLPGEIEMLFAPHGRFHDMGAGHGYHKGKFMGAEDRAEFLKGRIPSRWYSVFTWGSVYGAGGLIDILSNTYIKEVPGQLKREFEAR